MWATAMVWLMWMWPGCRAQLFNQTLIQVVLQRCLGGVDRIDSQLALSKGGDPGSCGWASSNQVKVLTVKPRFPEEEESLPEPHASSAGFGGASLCNGIPANSQFPEATLLIYFIRIMYLSYTLHSPYWFCCPGDP